jgi:glycosyltransferase involved in cell wall biosynthesis
LKLIIQIPAFNEEKTIETTLRSLPKKINGITLIETLVIDDGSTDGTADAARRAGANHVVRLLSNRGLATAFTTGIDSALRLGADIIVNTDADNQYRGSDVEKLVAPIVQGRAEVVIGDRGVKSSPHMSGGKRMLQRLGSWVVGKASGLNVKDVTSGFRAFSREAAYQLNVFNPFTYTLETIIQAGNHNLRVESVRIDTNPSTRPSRLYDGIGMYLRKSVATIFRVSTVYRPLKTFFALGALLFLAGFILGARFLYFYATEGSAGHIQSLILAAVLLISGFQTVLIGLLADLISVNRRLSEDVLVRLKKLDPTTNAKFERRRPQREERDEKRPPAVREKEERPGKKPAAPVETQWVWLVDEAKLDETPKAKEQPKVAVEPAPGDDDDSDPARRKRRRRRRRDGSVPHAEPHVHHRNRDRGDSGEGQAG